MYQNMFLVLGTWKGEEHPTSQEEKEVSISSENDACFGMHIYILYLDMWNPTLLYHA